MKVDLLATILLYCGALVMTAYSMNPLQLKINYRSDHRNALNRTHASSTAASFFTQYMLQVVRRLFLLPPSSSSSSSYDTMPYNDDDDDEVELDSDSTDYYTYAYDETQSTSDLMVIQNLISTIACKNLMFIFPLDQKLSIFILSDFAQFPANLLNISFCSKSSKNKNIKISLYRRAPFFITRNFPREI